MYFHQAWMAYDYATCDLAILQFAKHLQEQDAKGNQTSSQGGNTSWQAKAKLLVENYQNQQWNQVNRMLQAWEKEPGFAQMLASLETRVQIHGEDARRPDWWTI